MYCSCENEDGSEDVVQAKAGPVQHGLLCVVGCYLIEGFWSRFEGSLDEEECMERMVQYSQVLHASPELWLGSLGACIGSAHHLVVQSSSDLVACARDMLGRAMALGHCRSMRGGHDYAQGGRDVGRKPKSCAFNRDDPIGAPVPSKTSHGMATAPCTQVCMGKRVGNEDSRQAVIRMIGQLQAVGRWGVHKGGRSRSRGWCCVSRSGIPIQVL